MNIVTLSNSRRGPLRGFTLIELLVVIAIIGLLSAVVLAALNSARSRGSDASVEQNLSSIKKQAETVDYVDAALCYSSTGTCASSGYNAFCPTVSTTYPNSLLSDQKVIDIINSAVGNTNASAYCKTTNGQATWAVEVQLSSDSTKAYCVDNTGNAKIESVGSGSLAAMRTGVSGAVCL